MDALRYAAFMDKLLRNGEFAHRPRWATHKWIIMEGCDDFGELTSFDVQCLLEYRNIINAYQILGEMTAEGLIQRRRVAYNRIPTRKDSLYSLTDHGREKLARLRSGKE